MAYIKSVLTKIPIPDKKYKLLGEIFVWQEMETYAKARKEAAWKAAQDIGGLIDSDEDLREYIKGEEIVFETAHFSCIVKVSEARERFDRDTFIKRVAKKYKIPAPDLVKMSDRCKCYSLAPLTKRVIEYDVNQKEK